LLEPVMVDGRRIGDRPTLDEARDRARASLNALPAECLRLLGPERPPVQFTAALGALRRQMADALAGAREQG
jgi:Nicotinate phosphoribosyltransferase C-terminal domain